MKIKITSEYYKDSKWANFFNPSSSAQGDVILIKTASSYNRKMVMKWKQRLLDIGYILETDKRRWFKYVVQVYRIIPLYQRLICTDAFKIVKDENGKEKRLPVKVNEDILLYTDEDLEIIKNFSSKMSDISRVPRVEMQKDENGKDQEYIVYPVQGIKYKLNSRNFH